MGRSTLITPTPWDAPNRFGNRIEGYPPSVIPVECVVEDVDVPKFLPGPPQCRAELSQYYQSVSRIDQGLGRLQTLLAEAGKTKNTIVIYLSDNGVAFSGAKTTADGLRTGDSIAFDRQWPSGGQIRCGEPCDGFVDGFDTDCALLYRSKI